jgi:hypothetical protein
MRELTLVELKIRVNACLEAIVLIPYRIHLTKAALDPFTELRELQPLGDGMDVSNILDATVYFGCPGLGVPAVLALPCVQLATYHGSRGLS